MECLEKPIWNNKTWEAVKNLKIQSPSPVVYRQIVRNWDSIAKPLDGMGYFETLTAQIGAIQGTEQIDISKRAVIIMCADNGIVEEGISQTGQEVTFTVMKNMAIQQSSVGKMAKAIGVDTIPVDIGVNCEEQVPGVLQRKIRMGTRNFNIDRQ